MNIKSFLLFRGEAILRIKVSCQKRKAKGAGWSRVRMAPAMFSSFPVQRGAPNGRQAHPQVGLCWTRQVGACQPGNLQSEEHLAQVDLKHGDRRRAQLIKRV